MVVVSLPAEFSAVTWYVPASAAVMRVKFKVVYDSATLIFPLSTGEPLSSHVRLGCGWPVTPHSVVKDWPALIV